jgi:zinc protease
MALFLPLIAAIAQGGAADPLVFEAKSETLPNGLTVMIVEDKRTDTVALHLTYGVGSRDERDGEHGCAHLFEHLMFEGSKNVPTNAFDDWLTAAGGENNAFTSQDETAYHMTFPSSALDLALFLESDRMAYLDAGLGDENLKNQQSVVLQERYQGFAEPHGRDWDALTRLMYPDGHPYEVSTIGTVADVEGFTTAGVLDFWKRHYRPRNAVLVLVGNVDADAAMERVKHWFSDVPDTGAPEARLGSQVELPSVAANGHLEDNVEDWTMMAAWRTVPSTHPDAEALDVLGWVLSGGRGTRLDDALYYDKPLTTDAGAGGYTAQIDGEFLVYATSDKPRLEKLLKITDKVLADLPKHPPTEDELERARQAIHGGMLDMLESPPARAEAIASCYVERGQIGDCLSSRWARYQAVTSADVVRVAQAYLRPERRSVLTIIPMGDDNTLPASTLVELP